jgi:ABC-type multidrug transport system fused ATPase/permease subunit
LKHEAETKLNSNSSSAPLSPTREIRKESISLTSSTPINFFDKSKSFYRNNEGAIIAKQQQGEVATMMAKEDRDVGHVTFSTYVKYFSAALNGRDGKIIVLILFILYTIGQAVRVGSDMWVGIWATDLGDTHHTHTAKFYVTIYTVFVILAVIFLFGRAIYVISFCINASHNLHRNMIHKVLQAPINLYFDITPIGRIMNRFSKDLDSIDNNLPDNFLTAMQYGFHFLSVILLCILSTPLFIILVTPLGVLFYLIQKYFRSTSREVKRLDSITRSPVYSLFSEIIDGLCYIRAYQRETLFMSKFHQTLDANVKHFFLFTATSRWLSIRLDLLSAFIAFAVSFIAVLMTKYGAHVNQNLLGVALVYAIQLTGLLQWTVRTVIETENSMTSLERLLALNAIPSERSSNSTEEISRNITNNPINGQTQLDTWPTLGHINVQNLTMRYRPDLSNVLKDVSFTIPGGCKVGICGRTGSGKSSLTLALFRIVEPDENSSIVIDNVNILEMDLSRLRSRLTIIPQDPVMFCGTLKYNLDPFNRHTDMEIWEALSRVHMKEEIISKFPNQLSHMVQLFLLFLYNNK